MPMIDADGCPIYVEVTGRDDAPALMLSNSLGTDLHMWDDQAPEFAKHFRLVRYDRRGHGKSGVTKGPYNFALFGRDILKIMVLMIKSAIWHNLTAPTITAAEMNNPLPMTFGNMRANGVQMLAV